MKKLQKVMLMFLQNPNTWYTMKTAQVKVNGEVYKPNNVFDSVKMLERLKLPTGRKMRFERNWVMDNKTGRRKYCEVRLQKDLDFEELKWLNNLNNIRSIKVSKSKSIFDRIFNIFN